ncbi:MAG: hypothetical protein M9962_06340 [Oligoflexia bacterium]|nr:hypothetical protein [Oligoflexia bacterium]
MATATILSVAFFFSSCAMFESRPAKQLAYAESAWQAAILVQADSNPDSIAVFQMARDQLAKARSFYRLKNFKEARKIAVQARRLFEEAEWRSIRGGQGSDSVESLVK